MDHRRVVGPRGLCRPLDEKQRLPTNTSPLAPCEGCSKAGQRTTSRVSRTGDRAGQVGCRTFGEDLAGSPLRTGPGGPGSLESTSLGPRLGPGSLESASLGPQTPLGVPPQVSRTDSKRSIARLGHYSPRIPGGFTLPHRSDGTLGRGPRSEPRAPMQMVSGALGSLGFRVWGLGFRVWGLGFGV